jgi:hypothetical protein
VETTKVPTIPAARHEAIHPSCKHARKKSTSTMTTMTTTTTKKKKKKAIATPIPLRLAWATILLFGSVTTTPPGFVVHAATCGGSSSVNHNYIHVVQNIGRGGGGGGGNEFGIRQPQSPNKQWTTLRNWWKRRLARAGWLSRLEQSVQDVNAEIIASAQTVGDALKKRRLICLPLDHTFDPPMGNFAHGHVEFGDKMSLPSCFMQAILLNRAPVPFLFAVRRIDGVTSPRVEYKDQDDDDDMTITPYRPCRSNVNEAVGGPLDCRAPSCYVFLPLWMMRLVRFYFFVSLVSIICCGC